MTTVYEAAQILNESEGAGYTNGKAPPFKPAVFGKALLDSGLRVAVGGGKLHQFDFQLGTYLPADNILNAFLCTKLGADWLPSRADAVTRWLRDTAPALWDVPPTDRINVANGILNIDTEQLEEHSPDFLTSTQIPVAWNIEAVCPRIDKFLSEVTPPDVIDLPYEINGYYYVPDTRFEKAFLYEGTGANGKSVELELSGRMLGAANVSHMSLEELAEDRFAPAQLYGKLANICADIPDRQMKHAAMFKRLVSADWIMAQHKNGHPFSMKPFARLSFSANKAPASRDTGYAYMRRWQLKPFPRTFTEQERDRDLIHKITTPDEMEGFLVSSIWAYKAMLIRDGVSTGFTSGESTTAAMARFEEDLNPAVAFIRERTYDGKGAQIGKTSLYKEYVKWTESQGNKKAVSARTFNASLTQEIPELGVKKTHGLEIWVGIGVAYEED